jgi:hypothetical protein
MFRGEVRRVGFFDPDDLTTEVVREDVVYTRAANGLALSRETVRTWFCEDGTAHPVGKTSTKVYSDDPVEQMDEGERRRGNVIKRLTIDVLGMLAATQTAGNLVAAELLGRDFTDLHAAAITSYLRIGDNATLQGEVVADPTPWLDNDLAAVGAPGVTIRQAIVSALAGIMEA